MSITAKPPFKHFTELDGTALEAGKIYVGVAGLDAEANPITAYWDSATTIAATQPIRTTGGAPDNSGTPSDFFTIDDYSITVRDKNDVLIYSKLQLNENDPSFNAFTADDRVKLDGIEPIADVTKDRYSYTQMGKAFDQDVEVANTDDWAGWPHATTAYDADDDKFVTLYNTNQGHEIALNQVWMTKKGVESTEFETPVSIAEDVGVYSFKCQSFGIAANGDYVALIARANWTSTTFPDTFIYRSVDQGANWTSTIMLDAGDASKITAFNGDVSGFLVLASGRILTLAVDLAGATTPYLTRIYYSDNNGATWNKSFITGSPTHATEPGWIELPDGTIIAMLRADVILSQPTDIVPAKFTKSLDGGLTWAALADSTSILELTQSNGQMILDEDAETVEFIHHSRYKKTDEFTSLFVSRATYADAANDNFGDQLRIGKLTSSLVTTEGSPGDSGYVGAAKSAGGVINVFYYSGQRDNAHIGWMIGRKTATQEREYLFDYTTGRNITITSRGAYESPIYQGPMESHELNVPMINGLVSGGGEFSKREGVLRLTATGVSRAAGKILGGIDLAGVSDLYVHYNATTMDAGTDIAIALYNKETPTTPTDGRVQLEAVSKIGRNVVRMDVSELTGVYYPQVLLSNDSTGGANALADVLEFGMTSNVFATGAPSLPLTSDQLYLYGNHFPYISNDWVAGFEEGSPNTDPTFETESMELVVDGTSALARQSIRSGLIDLTDVNAIEMIVEVDITDTAASDFGIALFNKSNPTSGTDGRLAFNYEKDTGRKKSILDVRAYTSGYIFLLGTANSSGSDASTVTARVFDVRMY